MAAETIKLVLIWLHCLHALLCIAFIADLILILHLSGFCRRFCRAARQICFNQSEALPRSGQWHVISMEFLHLFFRRQFAGKSVGRRLFSKALLFREGCGGPAPLIFRPKWRPKGGKKFFGDRPPPLISGSKWPPHPPPPPPAYLKVLIRHWLLHLFFCESLQETIMNITEVSEAAITVRGTFFPPGINKSDVFLS